MIIADNHFSQIVVLKIVVIKIPPVFSSAARRR